MICLIRVPTAFHWTVKMSEWKALLCSAMVSALPTATAALYRFATDRVEHQFLDLDCALIQFAFGPCQGESLQSLAIQIRDGVVYLQ